MYLYLFICQTYTRLPPCLQSCQWFPLLQRQRLAVRPWSQGRETEPSESLRWERYRAIVVSDVLAFGIQCQHNSSYFERTVFNEQSQRAIRQVLLCTRAAPSSKREETKLLNTSVVCLELSLARSNYHFPPGIVPTVHPKRGNILGGCEVYSKKHTASDIYNYCDNEGRATTSKRGRQGGNHQEGVLDQSLEGDEHVDDRHQPVQQCKNEFCLNREGRLEALLEKR